MGCIIIICLDWLLWGDKFTNIDSRCTCVLFKVIDKSLELVIEITGGLDSAEEVLLLLINGILFLLLLLSLSLLKLQLLLVGIDVILNLTHSFLLLFSSSLNLGVIEEPLG